MDVVLSAEAAEQLEAQVRNLRNANALKAAADLSRRVMAVLIWHLAEFPRTGRHLPRLDLWETWIPGTKLIEWYRIETDHRAIATVWHASQDRSRGGL